jgi:hypothetical protein
MFTAAIAGSHHDMRYSEAISLIAPEYFFGFDLKATRYHLVLV